MSRRATARVVFDKAIAADPQQKLPPIDIDTPQTGAVRLHHASFIMVTEAINGSASRIALTIGFKGCPCGCREPGTAFMYMPSPDHARQIAAQLLAIAEGIEATAAAQAAEALRKAAGR